MTPLRVGFFGTPEFAVPSLEVLLEGPHEVVVVATQPDRARGRGRSLRYPPVKEVALRHAIPLLQPRRARDHAFHEALASLALDLIVVTAYGLILPKRILDLPRLGCINVHASLLPKYRGAAPIQWAIARGEQETGVTTMLMDAGMDTGDILLQAREPIAPDDTAASLHDRLARRGADLLRKTIEQWRKGEITPRKQDDAEATYAPLLKKEDGRIDWRKPAREIEWRVRGFFPWPGSSTFWRGKRLKIVAARAMPRPSSATPGEVLDAGAKGIEVATGEGTLLIEGLQREGRKALPIEAFLRGTPIGPGDRFESPEPAAQGSAP